MIEQNTDRMTNAIGVIITAAVFIAGIVLFMPDLISSMAGVTDGYDIIYELNGGYGDVDRRHIGVRGEHSVPIEEPTLDNYHFEGWYGIDLAFVKDKAGDLENYDNVTAQIKAGVDKISEDLAETRVTGDRGYFNDFEVYLPQSTFKPDSHLIMLASWTIRQHDIEYSLNGGVGEFPAQRNDYLKPYTLYAHEPTRVGHGFRGWKSDITFEISNAGDTVDITADTIFDALWTRDIYTVEYDLNGGDGTFESAEIQYMDDYKISNLEPLRVGHTFTGWVDELGDKYLPGDIVTVETSKTLTAQWDVNSYNVSYDLKGGEGHFPPDVAKFNEVYKIAQQRPKRRGYTFKGWNVKGDVYDSGSELTITKAEDYVLEAIWEINSYTIRYDLNGGSGNFPSATQDFKSSYAISTSKPTRTGYTFMGWTMSTNNTVVQAGGNFIVERDVTLTAKWTVNRYTVTYVLDGGSGSFSTRTLDYGDMFQVINHEPTRPGHTFEGWRHDATRVVYKPGDQFKMMSRDVRLIAIWSTNDYTVRYDLNGGSGSFQSSTLRYNTSYRVLGKPQRAGWEFIGWRRSDTGSIVHPNDTFRLERNVTLRAQWKINQYTVTYDTDSGSGSFPPQIHNYGASHTVTTRKTTYPGWVFIGWRRTDTNQDVKAGSSLTVDRNIILKAQWRRETYTVSFNANGGSGAPAAQTKEYGRTLSLSNSKPTREYYNFAGWTTRSNGGGSNYQAGSSFGLNENTTLYAQWTRRRRNVRFNTNGGSGGSPNTMVDEGSYYTLTRAWLPTRGGHMFAGWTHGGKRYNPSTKVWVGTSDVTLTAQWRTPRVGDRIRIREGARYSSTSKGEQGNAIPYPHSIGPSGLGDVHEITNVGSPSYASGSVTFRNLRTGWVIGATHMSNVIHQPSGIQTASLMPMSLLHSDPLQPVEVFDYEALGPDGPPNLYR